MPWLKADDPPVLEGRSARLRLAVPSVPNQPGESLLGRVQITANGNQRCTVAVSLAVAGSASAAKMPRAGPTPPVVPPDLAEAPDTKELEPPVQWPARPDPAPPQSGLPIGQPPARPE